ncbi:putative DNA-repair protein [Leishmania major strain Friedlin]|uniref:Putative DNA-repair protein n=1 Tax=Leishmania major TaxID=5664 RepID=E9AFG9_LEIMA|nr:putative DNA-repair protein [Leishmania major strain Friedlin]CAG9582700.1 DNA-repair_protein_-_putative [Leishmania major strain Friedlin]CBZ12973.1 putative DNA-repair protein [Leishmania major strain Friedlin]|eukprot:XP_003722739.1 putative DNA-repair protein [Leishmania major strain Friedlin]
MAMVTSASVPADPAETRNVTEKDQSNLAADVDEWDEVELPVAFSPAKKQEESESGSLVKKGLTDDGEGEAVKHETAYAVSTVKTEVTTTTTGEADTVTSGGVKEELVSVDTEAAASDRPLMEWAQLPLVGRPRASDTWRQRDPAYEAMMEQRDLLAAKRRSERIQRVCESLFALLAVLIRARLLWRESCHPGFVKQLLRLHVSRGRGPKRSRCEDPSGKATSAYVFLKAVATAKVLVAESTKPSHRKPSLAPAWVTCAKDAVQNKTSAAVKVLIETINDYFKLEALAAPASSSGREAPVGAAAYTVAPSSAEQDFSDWSMPVKPGFLFTKTAERHCRVSADAPLELPHPLYFSLVFLALARVAGLSCRLVVAKLGKTQLEKARAAGPAGDTANGYNDTSEGKDNTADGESEDSTRRPLRVLSIFEGREKRKASDRTDASGVARAGKGSKRQRPSAGLAEDTKDREELKSKKLPTSCYWVEVWSAERESFLSVNPCQSCATLWGASYTLSVSGHVAVDATPRYISKYSTAYAYGRRLGTCRQHRFLWRDELAWDDTRELSEVLRATFNVAAPHTSSLAQRQQQRESRQLHSLMYSEAVPTTLNALHRHPLYVTDSDLARHEGVYPKDANTTVGSVKGRLVYKRSAVVSLRSRDGWLREGRSLLTEDQPAYKVVAPPASRPFAAPSTLYGRWQTQPFEPLPLTAGDPPSIPHHGRTSWYILLDKAPPQGIVHLTQPQISRVARRMKLDFCLAVVGFERRRTDEHRRGHWETVINGIVVKETDSVALLHAYEEWVQLVQEQEATKRRQRAFHWWLLLAQRLLALKRLQDQYAKGLGAGSMPMQ